MSFVVVATVVVWMVLVSWGLVPLRLLVFPYPSESGLRTPLDDRSSGPRHCLPNVRTNPLPLLYLTPLD